MTVKQIENALDLLEYFADRKRPASLSQIHHDFGWPRSSTYNILSTLVDRGYMYEPSKRGGYYPTPRWLRISDQITAADTLGPHLHEMLENIAEITGETAAIAAPAGLHTVYLDVVESQSPIRYAAHVGKRLPIHTSSSGRSLLSQYSATERASILRKVTFERYRPNSLMSVDAVEVDIRISKKRGWFQSFDEYGKDLGSIAIPMPLEDRRLSLLVGGPIFRMQENAESIAGALHRMFEQVQAREEADEAP